VNRSPSFSGTDSARPAHEVVDELVCVSRRLSSLSFLTWTWLQRPPDGARGDPRPISHEEQCDWSAAAAAAPSDGDADRLSARRCDFRSCTGHF
jgi:hypothetical protein